MWNENCFGVYRLPGKAVYFCENPPWHSAMWELVCWERLKLKYAPIILINVKEIACPAHLMLICRPVVRNTPLRTFPKLRMAGSRNQRIPQWLRNDAGYLWSVDLRKKKRKNGIVDCFDKEIPGRQYLRLCTGKQKNLRRTWSAWSLYAGG